MLLRNLATALLEHGRIETTLAKAKEVQPLRREADHPRQGRVEPE